MFFSGTLLPFRWSNRCRQFISGSSAFSKSSLNMWKFTVHVLLKPGLEDFEHFFDSIWDECNCVVVWTFFGIAFLWDLLTPGSWLHVSWIHVSWLYVSHVSCIIGRFLTAEPPGKSYSKLLSLSFEYTNLFSDISLNFLAIKYSSWGTSNSILYRE